MPAKTVRIPKERMRRAQMDAHNEVYRVALTPPHAQDRDDRRGILWKPKFVPGEGPMEAKLVIIGEAPGEHEDREGRPFVGRSGALLDEALAHAGIDRADVYITNLVKFQPLANADPDPETAVAAAGFMKMELKIIKPLIVVPMGKFASLTFWLDDPTMGMLAGQRFTMRPYGSDEATIVMPMYHPSFILRKSMHKPQWFTNMRKIKETLDGLMRKAP